MDAGLDEAVQALQAIARAQAAAGVGGALPDAAAVAAAAARVRAGEGPQVLPAGAGAAAPAAGADAAAAGADNGPLPVVITFDVKLLLRIVLLIVLFSQGASWNKVMVMCGVGGLYFIYSCGFFAALAVLVAPGFVRRRRAQAAQRAANAAQAAADLAEDAAARGEGPGGAPHGVANAHHTVWNGYLPPDREGGRLTDLTCFFVAMGLSLLPAWRARRRPPMPPGVLHPHRRRGGIIYFFRIFVSAALFVPVWFIGRAAGYF